jgi:thiamine biosynthesis protein ThiS
VEIRLNGEKYLVRGATNLLELLGELSLPVERIAVERNREVVRREELGTTPIAADDRVEVVQLVGGG